MTVSEAEIIYFISRCKCQGVKLFLCGLQSRQHKKCDVAHVTYCETFQYLGYCVFASNDMLC